MQQILVVMYKYNLFYPVEAFNFVRPCNSHTHTECVYNQVHMNYSGQLDRAATPFTKLRRNSVWIFNEP
jgi:hypothetical protein